MAIMTKRKLVQQKAYITRCYISTRVYTQMQEDGYSLDAQQDRLRAEGP